MKVVFTIEVGVDVSSYADAGKCLDLITQNIKEVVGETGAYDVGSFMAKHRSLDRFRYPDENRTVDPMPMAESPARIE